MKYLPPSIEHLASRLFSFERRSGDERNDAIILTRRRIYILPTYYGILFSMLLMLLLVGSTNYNNSLGFVLTFLLASVGLVSIIHTYRNLLNLEVRAGKATAVFCDEPATFSLQLLSTEKHPRYNLCVRFKGEPAIVTNLDNGETTETKLTRPTTQRGWLDIEQITIDSVFPLGLFRAWSHCTLPKSCMVYPRPAEHSPLPTGGGVGAGNNSPLMGDDDFIGFRDYHPGDSPRHINWKAAAHSDQLLTKQFGDHESTELWFEWESLSALDSEARLSQLCRWIIDAEQNEINYGLRLPGTMIAPAQGSDHRHQCLSALALYPAA